MTVQLTYPAHGRGAWSKTGGTLNLVGDGPGPFFRAPAGDDPTKRIGYAMARIVAAPAVTAVSVDDYAVWCAARAIQYEVGTAPDGIWGGATDAAVKAWQSTRNLDADGIFGPVTARALWTPVVDDEVGKLTLFMPNLNPLVASIVDATITLESGWDAAAVGVVTSKDLGIGQINGDAHPQVTPANALSPRYAVRWIASFITDNLNYSGWDVDAAIACYNAGQGGATTWVQAGKPAGRIADYVQMVRSNMKGS